MLIHIHLKHCRQGLGKSVFGHLSSFFHFSKFFGIFTSLDKITAFFAIQYFFDYYLLEIGLWLGAATQFLDQRYVNPRNVPNHFSSFYVSF